MNRIYRFPLLNVVIILGITLFFLIQLPRLQMDNDTMNFVPENDPALIAIEDFEEQYGSFLIMDLVLTNPYNTILDSEGLEIINEITETLEELEGVEEIQSLTNTDFINGAGGTLRVTPLSEGSDGRFLTGDEIRQRLNSWEMYDLMLLSNNEHSTQIGITLDDDLEVEDRERIYNTVRAIASELIPSGYSFYLAGLPATTIQINQNIRTDLVVLIPFVVILVLIILYLSFRRPGGVLLPILNVAVSTIWTLGMMVLTNTPMTLLGSVIPVLMIAVGSAYGIHLISHYYDELDRVKPDSKERLREIVFHSVKVTGTPIAMAGLTTMAGFGALSISSVLPMRSFGIFTSFGVASALVVALTLIPSLLLLYPGKPVKKRLSEDQDHPLLGMLTRFSLNRKVPLLILSLILIAGSVFFVPRVIVDNDLVAYFKESTEVRQSERFIRENFTGTNSFNMVIYGDEKGALNNPEILLFMDNFKDWILENYTEVGKILSYSDFIKRINQVLNEDTPGKVQLELNTGEAIKSSEVIDSVWGDGFSGDNSFEDDSFEDDSFSSDSFSSDSYSFFSDEPEELFRENNFTEQITSTAKTSNLMKNLWTAYLSDPDNFMEALARLTNHKGKDYYEIPADPGKYKLSSKEDLSDLISQYLMLYSGNLSSWSDEALEPTQARMSVQLRVNGSRFTDKLIPELQAYVDRNIPDGYTLSFAGTAMVTSSLTHQIVTSAIRSIFLSIFLVFLILSITYRSPAAGVIGIVPLSLTVLVNFGVMGLTKIPMDISTAMVGSIAIGIGIDYTIHFMSSYSYHYRKERSPLEITRRAMNSSGKAIVFNAISVAAGFAVLIFSQFNPLMYFGALIVITMGVSSLASLTLLPLLLNSIKPKFLEKHKTAKTAGESKK